MSAASSALRLAGRAAAAGRGAWWALCALRHVRRELRRGPVDHVRIDAPRRLGPGGGRGVEAVLRGSSASCLERALVVQRWRASHGQVREIVIGVTAPGPGFRAHAWLDDERAPGFREITRFRPA